MDVVERRGARVATQILACADLIANRSGRDCIAFPSVVTASALVKWAGSSPPHGQVDRVHSRAWTRVLLWLASESVSRSHGSARLRLDRAPMTSLPRLSAAPRAPTAPKKLCHPPEPTSYPWRAAAAPCGSSREAADRHHAAQMQERVWIEQYAGSTTP
jgi:hypothetical protein